MRLGDGMRVECGRRRRTLSEGLSLIELSDMSRCWTCCSLNSSAFGGCACIARNCDNKGSAGTRQYLNTPVYRCQQFVDPLFFPLPRPQPCACAMCWSYALTGHRCGVYSADFQG